MPTKERNKKGSVKDPFLKIKDIGNNKNDDVVKPALMLPFVKIFPVLLITVIPVAVKKSVEKMAHDKDKPGTGEPGLPGIGVPMQRVIGDHVMCP